MALIFCCKCNKEYSTRHHACTGCGHPTDEQDATKCPPQNKPTNRKAFCPEINIPFPSTIGQDEFAIYGLDANEAAVKGAHSAILIAGGKNVYLILNPGASEWYVERLVLPSPTEEYEGFEAWWKLVKRNNHVSQRFQTKRAALAAINDGSTWFDGDFSNLELVKKASETGETINVKYWGGSRPGQPRHVTVLRVEGCWDPSEVDSYWYAEVIERGGKSEKTYRVDRMEILPTRMIDLIDEH